jgi:ADP-ribosylglycohydrolase
MQAQDYATVAVAVCTIVGAFTAAVRWLVKHYLNELKPNSGSSLKDSVIRLEEKVEILYQIMIQRGRNE